MIKELCLLKGVIEQMAVLLKTKGLSEQNIEQCRRLMKPLQQGRLLCFKQKVLGEWQNHKQKTKEGQTLICCSDVIESLFGRLKLQLKIAGTQALSESVLTICGFKSNITKENVKQAMNKVHVNNIEEWKQHNTIPSLQQKRRAFFQKNKPKLKVAA